MKILYTLIFIFITVNIHAQSVALDLYKANKRYKKGDYATAGTLYKKINSKEKNAIAMFNAGNTNYQQQQYDQALQQYQQSIQYSKDPINKAAALHNAGNIYLTKKKWDDAIQHFKQSLKYNPTSEETRYNLAYAQAMKKQQDAQNNQSDKNKQEPPPPKQQQNKDQQQQQDQQQNKSPENKQSPSANKDQQQNQSQNNQQSPEKNKTADTHPQQPQPMPSRLSKQQADQILNALQQEEKKLREKKEQGNGQPIPLNKDW